MSTAMDSANPHSAHGAQRKVVLVTRRTRLEELVARHNSLAQARYYVEHLGADFGDYVTEHQAYAQALGLAVQALQGWGRYQIVERQLLANFQFAASDIVAALGQDGTVANTLKYLDHGQPLIGLNPEPSRWDGLLLPFAAADLATLLPEVAADKRATRAVSMAQASLSDGQTLKAVNDLFIGTRGHGSALYELRHGQRAEVQSSSGIIVATGLGSTAWIKSVVTGAMAIAQSATGQQPGKAGYQPMAWDSAKLRFAVREPFPSRTTQTSLVHGHCDSAQPLRVRSRMPESGIIFSDGMEADFLRFTAGMEATITLARAQGALVV